MELQAGLQSAQREVQTLRKEHEDYKQRAAGILQVGSGIRLGFRHKGCR